MRASILDNTFRIGELITPETKSAISLVGATAITPDGVEMPLSEWREWITQQPPEVERWCNVRLAG